MLRPLSAILSLILQLSDPQYFHSRLGMQRGEKDKQLLQLRASKFWPAPLDPVCMAHIKSWQRCQAASSVPSCNEQLLRTCCILLETVLFIMSIIASHLCGETSNETQQLKSKAGLAAALPPHSSLQANLLSLRKLQAASRVMGRERGGNGTPLGSEPLKVSHH